MTNLPTLFEDSDLSQLPTTDPGGGQPWIDPISHSIIVGALGTFGLTQAAADARYLQLTGGVLTGGLTVSGAIVHASAGLDLRAAAGSWVTLYAGTTALFGARGSGYDGLMFNGSRLGFEGSSTGIGDAYVGRYGANELAVYSQRSGLGNALGNFRAAAGTFSGNLLPGASAAYNLGNSGARWQDCTLNGKIGIGNGSAANPSYYFNSAADTGSWLVSATVGSRAYAISTDGVAALTLGGSGNGRQADFAGNVATNGNVSAVGNIWTTGGTLTLGAATSTIVKSAVGQIDIRADAGFRVRNNANTGDAPLTAGAGTFGGVVYSTSDMVVSSGQYHGWNGRSRLYSPGDGTVSFRNNANVAYASLLAGAATLSGPLYLAPITFATLPSASAQTGARYRITDRAERECYSDGTNWRFAADDAIVT